MDILTIAQYRISSRLENHPSGQKTRVHHDPFYVAIFVTLMTVMKKSCCSLKWLEDGKYEWWKGTLGTSVERARVAQVT